MFGNLLADLDEPDFLAGYEVDEEEDLVYGFEYDDLDLADFEEDAYFTALDILDADSDAATSWISQLGYPSGITTWPGLPWSELPGGSIRSNGEDADSAFMNNLIAEVEARNVSMGAASAAAMEEERFMDNIMAEAEARNVSMGAASAAMEEYNAAQEAQKWSDAIDAAGMSTMDQARAEALAAQGLDLEGNRIGMGTTIARGMGDDTQEVVGGWYVGDRFYSSDEYYMDNGRIIRKPLFDPLTPVIGAQTAAGDQEVTGGGETSGSRLLGLMESLESDLYDSLSAEYLDPTRVHFMTAGSIAKGLNREEYSDEEVRGWLDSASFAEVAFERGLSAFEVESLRDSIWSEGGWSDLPPSMVDVLEEPELGGPLGDPLEYIEALDSDPVSTIDPRNLDGSVDDPTSDPYSADLTALGLKMDQGFFNLADLPEYEGWIPAYQRTPEEMWAGVEAQMDPFWQVRTPARELGRRLQARYMLAAPEMAMDMREGVDPTMAQYFRDWAPYAEGGFTGTAPNYFAYSDPNELITRAMEAGRAGITDPGKFVAPHERGTPEFARAAWLSSMFGPQGGAQSLQNQREIAGLLALQKPTGGAYRGQFGNAIRGAVANLQNRRAALGANPESFLNWFVSPPPGQAPKVLPRYGLTTQVAQEGERG